MRFEDYQDLPRLVLNRHFPEQRHNEDLLQEGRLELWRAFRDRDQARSFVPYAYKRILRAYLRSLRRREPVPVPLEHVRLEDPGAQERLEERELMASVARLLRRYPLELKVLLLRMQGYTFRQIAQQMHKSYSTVRRLAKRGGELLKERGGL